ncbi:MAG: undecaprenyl/decaprenyl-phosphate alpha-N-acetylglucosaminyl 1-phosphate transferase [Chitinophagales bacterium]|nr:undecaprenyl/decaprenyl-phosphate alpha-N-acetylglucosaminyl 1-phosphate transferase [Chitinophagales bacterium]
MFCATLTAFVLTYMFIPSIIKVAEIKHLFDTPDERKSHQEVIPTLGGIGIFSGFLISFCLFAHFGPGNNIQYVVAALCFMFMLGAKDDIVELVPYKKFIGQIFAAAIIVFVGNIRITSMYGLFDISMIDYIPSVILSMLTIIFIINAFNLIDGINLLAGGVGIIVSVAFGVWFHFYGFIEYAVLCAAMAGAVLAFLKYNYTPAKIFMGDSGSLSLGLLSAVLAIQFIEHNEVVLKSASSVGMPMVSSPAMAIAVLIIPVFDTLRVFTLRLINKKSPFSADRNHVHHRLIDLGLTHIQASYILFAVNIFFIAVAYYLQPIGNLYLLIVLFVLAMLLMTVLNLLYAKKAGMFSNPNKKFSFRSFF